MPGAPKPIVISKMSWLLDSDDRLTVDKLALHYSSLWTFLRSNGLLTSEAAARPVVFDRDFTLMSTDVTSEGMELVRAGYSPWVKYLDHSGDPANVEIMARSLALIRRYGFDPRDRARRLWLSIYNKVLDVLDVG
jgi:hypothetical protein